MKTIEASASGNEAGGASSGAGSRPKLEPRVQNALGRELRAMYDQVVSEPVPDRFRKLLDQLEQSEPVSQARPK